MSLAKKVTALLVALGLSASVAGVALRAGLDHWGVEARIGAGGATALALGLTLASGAVLALIAAMALDRLILGRVRELALDVTGAGDASTGSESGGIVRLGGGDEIDALASAFDALEDELEDVSSALSVAARKIVSSDIATGILHNVGNVLNSVNISASLVSQRVDGLSVEDLERLAAAIRDHQDDLAAFLTNDPRGRHIEPFLSALVTQLAEEQQAIRSEIDSLGEGIEHICELVKSQQRFAKGAAAPEPTDLAERVDDALRITQRVHGVDESLVVIRRYDEVGPVRVDRHRLLEILVNLLQNARQAMARSDGPRELTLEIRSTDGGGVRLAVADTGIGIPEQHLERIFQMGFTTREDGHGFGLHSSASAARELGGRLFAESDGEGRGARFVIDLPLIPPGHEAEPLVPDDHTIGGAA